jgi:cell division septum initiation protein DivIVA
MDKAIGPIVRALEDRLRELEKEIDRLTRQAASASDQKQQDQYWELARELQREARSIRKEIRLQLQTA